MQRVSFWDIYWCDAGHQRLWRWSMYKRRRWLKGKPMQFIDSNLLHGLACKISKLPLSFKIFLRTMSILVCSRTEEGVVWEKAITSSCNAQIGTCCLLPWPAPEPKFPIAPGFTTRPGVLPQQKPLLYKLHFWYLGKLLQIWSNIKSPVKEVAIFSKLWQQFYFVNLAFDMWATFGVKRWLCKLTPVCSSRWIFAFDMRCQTYVANSHLQKVQGI